MGLFDIFKRWKSEKKVTCGGVTFLAPKSISNEDYLRKRQKEVDRLERKYGLSTVASINAIPVPRKKECSGEILPNVTGRIEYYLMLKGGGYEKAGETELALACYRKANQLMPLSPISYQRDSYMRLPRYLRKLRRFDEARAEEAKIDVTFSGGSTLSAADELRYRESKASEFRWATEEGSDLVEVSWLSGCCETCGKYRGRIFSRTGADKRFPHFPSDFCEKCGLTYFTFLFGISAPQYSKARGGALIKEMNKPFTDTRTQQDLQNYSLVLKQQAEDRKRESARADYDWLWEFMPDICPKSFSGYMRMKNAKTEKYQMIVAAAKKHGHDIDA